MDASDVLFGEERLKTLLQTHHGDDPEHILQAVDTALSSHTAPGRPSDDVNIIVVQYPSG